MARNIMSALSAMVVLLLSVPAVAEPALPAYRIVSEDGSKAALRVAVWLDARQTEAKLKAIAEDVRRRLPAGKVVSAVHFYLPATALTGKAWADVRLTAQPAVTIAGLRLDEEEAYRAEAASDKRARVGVWLTSPPALIGRLTIYRDSKGQPFAEWRLRSGQSTIDALTEVQSSRGRQFVIADSDGGYYQIGANRALELGAQGRRIALAEPLLIENPVLVERAPIATALPAQTSAKLASTQTGASGAGYGAAAAAAKPGVRRASTARRKPAVRHAAATAKDAISRALAQ